ncbi:MAG TPA: hypothetical protein VGJ18_03895 [Gemmatimonadaceae bacterium]
MQSERRRSIILWGPPGSGKSLYLTSLVMWLTREHNERPLAVLPADDAAARWVARRSVPHPEGVALVDAGAAPANPLFRIYSITRTPDAAGRRSSLVGELTPCDAGAGEPQPRGMADAVGVMLLLPATTMATSPEARDACVSWFTTTLARLPEQVGSPPPAVSLPVAVCLTQTDEAPDATRRDASRWLESFGAEMLRALRAHCGRFAVFKISSTGRAPRKRDGVDVIIGAPEPRGVLAPIRWVLGEATRETAA